MNNIEHVDGSSITFFDRGNGEIGVTLKFADDYDEDNPRPHELLTLFCLQAVENYTG